VLGSSLTIPPANTIPETVGDRQDGKLVICNLQSTPLDSSADLRVFCKTDDLMKRVMEKLDLPIPEFILRRHLVIEMEKTKHDRHQLVVNGVDVDGTPSTFIRSINIPAKRRVIRSEPFVIQYRDDIEKGTTLSIELEFMGHYFEPSLEVSYVYGGDDDPKTSYLLEYNPSSRLWRTTVKSTL
jgi:hypothetical protein